MGPTIILTLFSKANKVCVNEAIDEPSNTQPRPTDRGRQSTEDDSRSDKSAGRSVNGHKRCTDGTPACPPDSKGEVALIPSLHIRAKTGNTSLKMCIYLQRVYFTVLASCLVSSWRQAVMTVHVNYDVGPCVFLHGGCAEGGRKCENLCGSSLH
jgi:hypothetical protein